MDQLRRGYVVARPWLAKAWVQWLLATIILFFISLLYMGNGIYNCSSATAALGSDSTGGFGWVQWAGGNDLSWGHTDKSNYPFGEDLAKPQNIGSFILILAYKLLSSLSTPICGLNLISLLAYMSTGLLMFGLIKWLFNRFDIALFAAYAAAFVPYHQLKSQSHINYMFGTIFIAIIWAYLWFMNCPSYKRATIFALVSILGFYFDGYFILISFILMLSLIASSYLIDFINLLKNRRRKINKQILSQLIFRTKCLLVTAGILILALLPILVTYKNNASTISQSLAAERSNIKSETLLYGLRPIEFFLPSFDNPLAPANYPAWRATKLHGSNFSESTLYVGYTIMILALISFAGVWLRGKKRPKLDSLPYSQLIFIVGLTFLGCFLMSLPYRVTVLGHSFWTPVAVLVKLTANWRVLARFFLVIDPLIIILASAGLYILTRNLRKIYQVLMVCVCLGLIFLEYLPPAFGAAQDLYKDAPAVYKKIAADPNIKIVAEYPLADFRDTPVIFTFQPEHRKTLVNANNGTISLGPFDSAIAGLNDPQTLGVLKGLGVDLITTHGFEMRTDTLTPYFSKPIMNQDLSINTKASLYSYKISNNVEPRSSLLMVKEGYSDLSVDDQQISHRIITNTAQLRVLGIKGARPPEHATISLSVNSVCDVPAQITVVQDGKQLWAGKVSKVQTPINFNVNNHEFYVNTAYCAVDITQMDSQLNIKE